MKFPPSPEHNFHRYLNVGRKKSVERRIDAPLLKHIKDFYQICHFEPLWLVHWLNIGLFSLDGKTPQLNRAFHGRGLRVITNGVRETVRLQLRTRDDQSPTLWAADMCCLAYSIVGIRWRSNVEWVASAHAIGWQVQKCPPWARWLAQQWLLATPLVECQSKHG